MGQTVVSFDETTGESHLRLYISGLFLAVTDLLRRQEPTLDESLTSTQRAVELFLNTLVERLDQPWDVVSMADSCGLRRVAGLLSLLQTDHQHVARRIPDRLPSRGCHATSGASTRTKYHRCGIAVWLWLKPVFRDCL